MNFLDRVVIAKKATNSILGKLAARLAATAGFVRFCADARGSTTMIVGLAAVPFTLAAGMAIDYARMSREETRFAAAVDAAALAVAASTRSNTSGLSDSARAARMSELEAYAKQHIAANYNAEFGTDSAIDLDLTVTDNNVSIAARHDFPTTIMSVSGIEKVEIEVFAEVTKAGNNIEVALILDNTNSMSGSRIASLRAAARNFVNTVVKDSQTPYYSKVAIVPYTMGVNVGSTYAVAARGSIASGTSTTPGSNRYSFTNPSGNSKTFTITNCVSERTGSEAYTDASVASNPVGRNYASSNNPCSAARIMPLSSNKSDLIASINAMTAGGSTAGHVGVAWGWYTLSPNFGLWTGNSVPAAYRTNRLNKVAVLMTDGEYNSPYCNGVISRDATNGSGPSSDHINCNATNGSSYAQAQALCDAMKDEDIIVYTIAFDLINTTAAQDLMTNCATDAEHRYDADNEVELQAVFETIANELMALRLSK
jgi:Flp pilus assembly protein TadG